MIEMEIEGKSTTEKRDLYEILGVEKTASEKEIQSKYRKLALKFHPDRNRGDEEACEKFKEINMAYGVLSGDLHVYIFVIFIDQTQIRGGSMI